MLMSCRLELEDAIVPCYAEGLQEFLSSLSSLSIPLVKVELVKHVRYWENSAGSSWEGVSA